MRSATAWTGRRPRRGRAGPGAATPSAPSRARRRRRQGLRRRSRACPPRRGARRRGKPFRDESRNRATTTKRTTTSARADAVDAMSAVDPPVDPPGAPPRNTPATTVSARFHTLSAYVARVSRATMPAGSARPNGSNGPTAIQPAGARVGSFGISPFPSVRRRFSLRRRETSHWKRARPPAAARGTAARRFARRRGRETSRAARGSPRRRRDARRPVGNREETTPIADHTLAIVIQSMTQHATMTRLNARAEPHTAASRHCPATSASAYRIRRHRFASGGAVSARAGPQPPLARVAVASPWFPCARPPPRRRRTHATASPTRAARSSSPPTRATRTPAPRRRAGRTPPRR